MTIFPKMFGRTEYPIDMILFSPKGCKIFATDGAGRDTMLKALQDCRHDEPAPPKVSQILVGNTIHCISRMIQRVCRSVLELPVGNSLHNQALARFSISPACLNN
jgi:hypothetical protein